MSSYIRHRRVDRNRHLYDRCTPTRSSGLVPMRVTRVGAYRAHIVLGGAWYLVYAEDDNGKLRGVCRATTNAVLAYKWHGQLVESLRRAGMGWGYGTV